MKPGSYARAGVDIGRGDRFVEFIKGIRSPAVSKGIGGFSGAFEVDPQRYRHPVFLTTTDGVGTKLLVARSLARMDTVGIDLVAMCVNDILVCGAEPVAFLDYIACGRVDEATLEEIMRGIVTGCELAGCSLSGGETAELPDMYAEGEFDLAGFAVGVVERDNLLPKQRQMREGDLVLGLPSVGIHSNGLSLARKVLPKKETTLWAELLKPTKIYAREMTALAKSGLVLGAAHVTGGGLESNFARILPEGLVGSFDFSWPVPGIFDQIQRFGRIQDGEMRRVFNMGIGIAFVVAARDLAAVERLAVEAEFEILRIGELARG